MSQKRRRDWALDFGLHSSSSLISSSLHSHVNLEWCDKIKYSNLLHFFGVQIYAIEADDDELDDIPVRRSVHSSI